MAQAKVTEFFNSRKRHDIHPSKRRKVVHDTNIETADVKCVETMSTRVTRQSRCKTVQHVPEIKSVPEIKAEISPTTKISHCKIKSKTGNSSKSKAPQKKKGLKKQNIAGSIDSFFTKPCESIPSAACDDHCASPPASPIKRKGSDGEINNKRSRGNVAIRKDLFSELHEQQKQKTVPETGFDFSTAHIEISSIIKSKDAFHFQKKSVKADERCCTLKTKEVPQEQQTSNVTEPSECKKTIIPKNVLSDEQKTKLKAKLQASSKLQEVKNRVAEFQKLAQQKKEKEILEAEKAEKEKVEKNREAVKKGSAYQRHHALAQQGPPTLSLPHKYKHLADIFDGMETVVSMLYKRNETCTFSKLKAAVQNIVRKNFETRHVGQVKTVYPDAYQYRQEKALVIMGQKASGYDLTVDVNLQSDGSNDINEKSVLDDNGRVMFTASRLLRRKLLFHNKMIDIVKQHHKEFLQTLTRPLSVPDNKITRWHPKFDLDSVPEVTAADLPKPPEVKVLGSAREVLEVAKGNLNSRIQRALTLAAGEELKTASKEDKDKKNEDTKTSTSTPVKANASTPAKTKGVSNSLLERIRAKEAAKQEAAMLRTPAEESRLQRIERLPQLCKILRSYYVTQKRPAIPMADALNKMSEGYKSALGTVESERHLELMKELVPEWIQIVKVKTGCFVKLSKNMDLNIVTNKLEKIFKDGK